MLLHLAHLHPIDWHAALSYQHVLGTLKNPEDREKLGTFRQLAERAIKNAGFDWEGDVRDGPYVITALTQQFHQSESVEALMVTGIYWKQSNNGGTFAASLLPLVLSPNDANQETTVDVEWPLYTARWLALPLELIGRTQHFQQDDEQAHDDEAFSASSTPAWERISRPVSSEAAPGSRLILHLAATLPIDTHDGSILYSAALEHLKDPLERHVLLNLRQVAEQAVLEANLGWEGDIREGPYLITARTQHLKQPDTAEALTLLGLYWKQDNNGDTFAATLLPVVTDALQEVTVSVPWAHHSAAALSLPLSLLEHQIDYFNAEPIL